MAKIAINGLGRIGRAALKIILNETDLDLVAVNDLIPNEDLAYLLKYDTVYRRYSKKVEAVDDGLSIDGLMIRAFSEKDPSNLPWKELGVDLVLECTGALRKREDLEKHLKAGASKVILSAPAKSDDIVTVVHGVTAPSVESTSIISCASCTTNCITPVAEIMARRIGVSKAMMTTVHAYTASQAIVDGPHKKPRRGRAGAANFVPTSTGAAKATTKVLPDYKGKFDGVAIRGPVPAGSIADLVFVTKRRVTEEEVIDIFKEEAQSETYKDILGVTQDPVVSSDIIQDGHAAVVDLGMTRVVDGDLVKIMAWYDNEWGYATQMVKEAQRIVG